MGPVITWRPVGRAELLEVSGADPYVTFAVGAQAHAVVGEHGWAVLHPWRPTGHWGGGAFVHPGAPADAESAALSALLARAPDTVLEWFSTAPGRALQAPAGLSLGGSGRWDFLTTDTAPSIRDEAARTAADSSEVHLVELDDARDAAEIEDFGREHNADFEGFPGWGFAELWLGLRDSAGALRGVGGMHLLATDVPHLSGIVVDRRHRGRGLHGPLVPDPDASAGLRAQRDAGAGGTSASTRSAATRTSPTVNSTVSPRREARTWVASSAYSGCCATTHAPASLLEGMGPP